MNDPENELKKALAENGTFDPEKARQLSAHAVSLFHHRLKKVERILWAYLLVCGIIGVFAFEKFVYASSTKSMLGFGILMLVIYETSVLLKLWYWIANTKITLLKEVKLLQIGSLSAKAPGEISKEFSKDPSLEVEWRGLSRWERRVWVLGIALAAAATAIWTVWHIEGRTTLTYESSVTLAHDGSGTMVDKEWFTYLGYFPKSVVDYKYTGQDFTITRWIDGQGRDLPIRVSQVGADKRYTIELAEPMMPGDRVHNTLTTVGPMARKRGDLWTYNGNPVFSAVKTLYRVTVHLPPGTEIVSVEPDSARWTVENGAPAVHFQAVLGRNERFLYSVQYRLRSDLDAEKTEK